MSDEENAYDVVIDTLQKQRDKLWEMTERNMESEFLGFNVMDEIRLKQIYTLNRAIECWKKYKYELVRQPEWVGLTDEQIYEHEWWHEETAFAVNKELKEMNSG